MGRGEGGGDARPAIVFLHGTRLTGASWAAQVAALSAEFRCIAPDLPGHGTAEDVTFTLEAAADHVVAVLDHHSPDRPVILVGLSLGGYVAMAVAASRPERVAGLVISGATAEPVGVRSLAYRGLATIFRVVPLPVLDGLNRWFFRWRFPVAVSGPILADGFSFRGGAVAVRALVGERFKPRLAAYPGPTLILNGEFDLFFRSPEGSFAAVAADPRRVLIRRATHLTNLDQPAAFAAAVRRFARAIA